MTATVPTLAEVRQALSKSASIGPSATDEPATADSLSQAAVAAILRHREDQTDLLFIRRAEHPLDPWSGHMAFPGGHIDPGDDGPLAAALRETREEIGLDLGRSARHLGQLPGVPVMARGERLQMSISPFVFELLEEVSLTPNHEVGEIVWVPLAVLADPRLRTAFVYRRTGVPLSLPCVLYRGNKIWGLTLGMADDLLASVGAAPGLPRQG
ncbi:MAG: CoA pyrophosphatase [Thermoanaerobaculia bacterium]|nr:CoA pyrophosphatase [Thermoanaerobaculia bacterium]